jgi:hypothetical protein
MDAAIFSGNLKIKKIAYQKFYIPQNFFENACRQFWKKKTNKKVTLVITCTFYDVYNCMCFDIQICSNKNDEIGQNE